MSLPVVLIALWLAAATPPAAGTEAPVDYTREIKPIFTKRCLACHGALKQKARLRLDTAESIRKGGDSGSAIESGMSSESLLIDKITAAEGERMPPEGEPLSSDEIQRLRAWIDQGAQAPADEKPQADPRHHWSFLPPERPPIPTVKNEAWNHNPIDAFLAAEHEARGLTPRPPAEPAELLRRVSLDLTGLAPTPQELRAYLDDRSSDAYEKAVDRLLNSPRYGERWGRHWMDVWRYSDWAGFGAEVRESQPHIWRWRDWIVESLNSDKGYDRMVTEMLAGDELAPDDPATLRATGYLVRNWYKFNRNSWLQNTVDHTAKAFLGVTLNCARCHDHKYDPFNQADYYALRAFFEPHDVRTDRVPGQADITKDGVPRAYDANVQAPTYIFARGDDKVPDKDHPVAPAIPKLFKQSIAVTAITLPPQAHDLALRPYVQGETLSAADQAIAQAKRTLDGARITLDGARAKAVEAAVTPDAGVLAQANAAVAKAEAGVLIGEKGLISAWAERESARARIAAEVARYADPPDSKKADILAIIASRAERQAAARKAEEAVIWAERALVDAQALKPEDAKRTPAIATATAKKAETAKALEMALAAANKLSSKFTSIAPVYPSSSSGRRLALARWISDRKNPLAARVAVNHVWMRHFGKPIVPTVFDFGLNGKPPTHPALLDWLAVEFMESGWSLKALHRSIVTSNAYRMQSSGVPQDPNAAIDAENAYLWRMNPRRMEAEVVRDNVLFVAGSLDTKMGGPELDQNLGLTTNRRSIYYRHAPEKMMTFLKLFDAANMNACYRRDESVVPQQALALANSPLALAQARQLARKLTNDVGSEMSPATNTAFVTLAFEQILARPATDEERSACEEYLTTESKRLADKAKLTLFSDGPPSSVAPSTDPNLRAREDLVHVLINHNDFVTIR
jgi:mono/diheme cytochrome c family protein